MTRPRVLIGSMLLIAVAAAACSSNPSPSASTSTTAASTSTTGASTTTTTTTAPTVASLEAAVRAYSAAYLGGDGYGAWALLSQRCQMKMAEIDYRATVAGAKVEYGSAILESLTGTVNGNQGRATYTYSDPAINQQNQPWVFDAGGWHYDHC